MNRVIRTAFSYGTGTHKETLQRGSWGSGLGPRLGLDEGGPRPWALTAEQVAAEGVLAPTTEWRRITLLSAIPVYNYRPRFLSTIKPVCNSCLQFLFTMIVFDFCLQFLSATRHYFFFYINYIFWFLQLFFRS